MRIRYELLATIAAAFALCLASSAEAAKKQRPKTVTAYSNSTSCAGATWGSRSGPICNGPDYIGNDPDPNIRAYIMKDLGSRYGGAF